MTSGDARGRAIRRWLLAAALVMLSSASAHLRGPIQTPTAGAQLAGIWRVSLREADGVELDFRMTFAVRHDGSTVRWEAYSRQGAAREMVGAGTAALGRLFGQMPPKEALIYIGDGTGVQDGDTVRLSGALSSPFLGRRTFTGSLERDRLRAELTRGSSGTKAGTIEAVRDTTTAALRDYAPLAEELERAIRERIFDPSLLARPEFTRFFAELAQRFSRSRDDLDVVGAFQAITPGVGLSHLRFIRNPGLAAKSLDEIVAGDGADPASFVQLGFVAPHVAFLDVTKWDRAGPAIARAFERMAAADTRVLILDIRGNPGGDATSMAPIAHLVTEPTTVGVFLGRRWYDLHQRVPAPAELSSLPTLTIDATPMQMLATLRDDGAVVGKVVPRTPHFPGMAFLLIDGRTASASEPLAHTLKVLRRATLIGERTAGHMLMALPQSLRDGWVATIPVTNFITADGVTLEGKGVEPDIKRPSSDVFLAVAEHIASALPFSGEVLRGGSYEGLKRPRDAERAYRTALQQADRQRPVPEPAARVSVHKRLAGILTARGDRQAALREYAEVLRLAPTDKEALAAVRGGKDR